MKTIREQFGTDPPLGEVQEYGNDFRLAKNRTSEIETIQAEIDYEVGFQIDVELFSLACLIWECDRERHLVSINLKLPLSKSGKIIEKLQNVIGKFEKL